MKMFSIIVPFYNESKNINISIDSLLRQSFNDFEVILVDDGSTDDSKEKIYEKIRNDDRFKYFYQNNNGVASARNYGLSKVSGKYIAFLDADDYYHDSFMEKIKDEILASNSDLCYCGYFTDNGDLITKVKTNFYNKNLIFNYLSYKLKVPTTGWVIRSSIIKSNNLKFREEVNWGEDTEFFTDVLAATRNVSYVSEYLVYYRTNNDSNQLSNFSINKIDEDYILYKNLISKNYIANDRKLRNLLFYYRLQGQIVYRLLESFDKNIEHKKIKDKYLEYNDIITQNKIVNGLRSLKLIYAKYILKRKINNISDNYIK